MAKIIFYTTVSPDRDDEAWGAFSLARRAVEQVRDRIDGRALGNLQAVIDGKVPISVAPG